MRFLKTFTFISILLSVMSCNIENTATDFTVTITPLSGEGLTLTTQEDTPILISYQLELEADSSSPWLKITKHPSNGSLNDCSKSNDYSLQCTYSPNSNFFGQDSFVLNSGDGSFESDKDIVITINVYSVNDKPVASSDTLYMESDSELEFVFLGSDVDSASQDLSYNYNLSSEAEGSLSCDKDLNYRACTYNSGKSEKGVVTISYTVTDDEGLSSDTGTIKINVSAQVYTNEVTFTQEDNGKAEGADILWVVDNSGSMADEQEALSVNFPSFAQNFIKNGKAQFPFNMGVTTTDAYYSGRDFLRGDASGNFYDLSSTQAESNYEKFVSDFTEAVLVGTNGLGAEKALDSADAILTNTNYSSWFSDDDNLLILILVTDEKEQSTSKTIAEWSSYLKNMKTNSEYVKVYSIINPAQDGNQRFAELASEFGTSTYDITESFDPILDNIGASISELISSYSLDTDHNIDESTLTVKVNGSLKINGTDYTISNNKIQFINVPEEGANIVVRYSYTWN